MDREEKTAVLARLCRVLARPGVEVQLRDAVPRLVVRSSAAAVGVWVTDGGLVAWGPEGGTANPDEFERVADEVMALLAVDRSGQ
ncbi:hypothetical protein LO762_22495 [Actinocorallia sp. API 0066]|uniref:hypothetical protein n=1 Tax=Actinocorallia sp. API 0066 TaxID=2896846 RepID=UPI001E354F51|nr:hypothetical protein [Actinocorallia sp. API 0066]MCD0451942.1 hypothetical protein [Actinocorallia sp. API 0066]